MTSISKMNKFNSGLNDDRLCPSFLLFISIENASAGTYDETITYDFQLHFNYIVFLSLAFFSGDFPIAIALCCCAMGGNVIVKRP